MWETQRTVTQRVQLVVSACNRTGELYNARSCDFRVSLALDAVKEAGKASSRSGSVQQGANTPPSSADGMMVMLGHALQHLHEVNAATKTQAAKFKELSDDLKAKTEEHAAVELQMNNMTDHTTPAYKQLEKEEAALAAEVSTLQTQTEAANMHMQTLTNQFMEAMTIFTQLVTAQKILMQAIARNPQSRAASVQEVVTPPSPIVNIHPGILTDTLTLVLKDLLEKQAALDAALKAQAEKLEAQRNNLTVKMAEHAAVKEQLNNVTDKNTPAYKELEEKEAALAAEVSTLIAEGQRSLLALQSLLDKYNASANEITAIMAQLQNGIGDISGNIRSRAASVQQGANTPPSSDTLTLVLKELLEKEAALGAALKAQAEKLEALTNNVTVKMAEHAAVKEQLNNATDKNTPAYKELEEKEAALAAEVSTLSAEGQRSLMALQSLMDKYNALLNEITAIMAQLQNGIGDISGNIRSRAASVQQGANPF